MKNKSGVYEILNTVNGKRYIGQAAKLGKRWIRHQYELGRRTHHSRHLQSAWNKYGSGAFEFRALLICAPTKELLTLYEQACFNAYKPEYNIQPVANSPLGMKHTPETCAKLSARNKGNKYAVGNTNALGYHHAPDACARIGAAARGNKWALGYKHTPEEIEQIRLASLGRKMSPEAIAKTVAARLGTKHSPEAIEKMRRIKLGKKHSPEAIERCRLASTGRTHSVETKAKLSALATAQHAARRAAKSAASQVSA